MRRKTSLQKSSDNMFKVVLVVLHLSIITKYNNQNITQNVTRGEAVISGITSCKFIYFTKKRFVKKVWQAGEQVILDFFTLNKLAD